MNIYWVGGILIFYLASCVGCGYLGYQYEAAKCSAADAAHDLADSQNAVNAQQHVVSNVQEQGIISQEASSNYAKSFTAITGLYGVQQPPVSPGNNLHAVRLPASGACPAGSAESKAYGLTLKQCDIEEAKCVALWNWAEQQTAIR